MSSEAKCDLKEFDFFVNQDLETKILIARQKIKEAYAWSLKSNKKLYISFSGGKDSILLSDLVTTTIGKVTHITSQTGIEFPGIHFVKEFYEGQKLPFVIKKIKSSSSIKNVVEQHGYPLLSKPIAARIERAQKGNGKIYRNIAIYHKTIKDKKPLLSAKCCNYFRKGVLREIPGIQFLGIRAPESFHRKMTWHQKSCFYDITDKVTYMLPIVFFKDVDVHSYIVRHNIKIPIQYHLGWERTGCWPCGFGAPFMRPNNYQLLRIWYPRMWHGIMYKWGFKGACDAVFIKTGSELTRKLIDDFRKEKYDNLTDERYKKDISDLIDNAEMSEKLYNLI